MRRIALALGLLAGLAGAAAARNATGYVAGEKTTIKIVDVDGKDVEAKTAKAFRVMQKAAHKNGVSLGIRSGYRSYQKQAQLYKDYRRGRGNLAAPPGYSNHESGRALDLYVTDHHAYDWLREHAAAFGFHRTVPTEAWHWEYLGDESHAVARATKRRSKKAVPAIAPHPAPAPEAAPEPEHESSDDDTANLAGTTLAPQ